MNVSVIGTGYVGLVTGSCLAEIGHKVICFDSDKKKIRQLKKLIMPIYEPGLEEIVKKNVKRAKLSFTENIRYAIINSEVIFICVGTPPHPDGRADLTAVEEVASQVARYAQSYKIVVEKSTVPVETGQKIKQTISLKKRNQLEIDVVSNPEFLREGTAIQDFLHPSRIVLGVETKRSEEIMRALYKRIKAPILVTDVKSAELIKHASNSFLATKISFINAVANICDRVGANVEEVAHGMGLDPRIGSAFLKPGLGFGGSCFPKDLAAFIWIAKRVGYDFELLKVVEKINLERPHLILKILGEKLWILKGKTIAILGLSFKPNTDDVRKAPALEVIKLLQKEGAKIKAYDPKAIPNAKKEIKGNIKYCQNVYEAARNSDALILATEWPEFEKLNLKQIKAQMKTPIFIDARNVFNPKDMESLGFIYESIGR